MSEDYLREILIDGRFATLDVRSAILHELLELRARCARQDKLLNQITATPLLCLHLCERSEHIAVSHRPDPSFHVCESIELDFQLGALRCLECDYESQHEWM